MFAFNNIYYGKNKMQAQHTSIEVVFREGDREGLAEFFRKIDKTDPLVFI